MEAITPPVEATNSSNKTQEDALISVFTLKSDGKSP